MKSALICVIIALLIHCGHVHAGFELATSQNMFPLKQKSERFDTFTHCTTTFGQHIDFSKAQISLKPEVIIVYNLILKNRKEVDNVERRFVAKVLPISYKEIKVANEKDKVKIINEKYEVAIGRAINSYVNTVKRFPLYDVDDDEISKYVGFVETVDFGICSVMPIINHVAVSTQSGIIEKFKEWLKENIGDDNHNLIDRLYIITEQLADRTYYSHISNPKWMTKRYDAWKGNAQVLQRHIKLEGLDEDLLPNFDAMRSFLIQMLSTLWYGTELEFTHWDLHSGNIVATKHKEALQAEFWQFDFMPFGGDDVDWTADCRLKEPVIDIMPTPEQLDIWRKEYEFIKDPKSRSRKSHDSIDLDDPDTERLSFPVWSRLTMDFAGSGSRAYRIFGAPISENGIDGVYETEIPESIGYSCEVPPLRFRVPPSATKGEVFKIIDYGHARLQTPRGNRLVSGKEPYYPFSDTFYLAMETVKRIPENFYRNIFKSKGFEFLPEAYRESVKQDYMELSDVLAKLIGLNIMPSLLWVEVQHACFVSLPPELYDESYETFMHVINLALNTRGPNKGDDYTSIVEAILTRRWIYRHMEYMKQKNMKQEFRKFIVNILNMKFFDKFKRPAERGENRS